MKLQKQLLAALAVCLLLGSSAMAATKVTLSNVHLCCGKCEVGANKALATVDGAEGKVDRKAGTIAITADNDATAQNPAYIQLQALKTLAEMSKDPAAKLYFLDSNSPSPLPLLHMGDNLGGK